MRHSLPEESDTRDVAQTWLDKPGEKAKDVWNAEKANLVTSASALELKMVALLNGMLEGETDVYVAEHVLDKVDGKVLISLLNLHWQKHLALKKKTKVQTEMLIDPDKREEAELAFHYFVLADTLTDDMLFSPSALQLRKLFQRWLGGEGKESVASIRSVEILNADGELGRVHFKMPEFAQLVWFSDDVEMMKQEIIEGVSTLHRQDYAYQ